MFWNCYIVERILKKKNKKIQIFFHVDITKDNELQNLSLHYSFLTEMSQLANEN